VEDVRASPSTSRSKRRENGKKKTILGSTLEPRSTEAAIVSA
jgi:hypothetical protein